MLCKWGEELNKLHEREWDAKTVTLEWNGEPPVNKKEMEDLVREDISVSLKRLGRPSDLAMHSVFLKGLHGPSIAVDGKDDDSGFILTWYEKTKWVTFSGADLVW